VTPILFGNVCIALSSVLFIVFLVSYQLITHGAWMRNEMGRHIFWFVAALAEICALSTIHSLFATHDPQWFQWLRAVSLGFLPIIAGWRIVLLYGLFFKRRARERGRAGSPDSVGDRAGEVEEPNL